jgi:hypothetical protein
VIRYFYLRSHEAKAGHEGDSKERPCAVLLTTTTKAGGKVVTGLPVLHDHFLTLAREAIMPGFIEYCHFVENGNIAPYGMEAL